MNRQSESLRQKTIYGFRYDERLETKVEESTRLGWTLLCPELEHLKIETKFINTTTVSENIISKRQLCCCSRVPRRHTEMFPVYLLFIMNR